ncbi:uncharacterized protein LOC127004942 isoform X2 [Eriocheir sinensis]|uniref:uncharacterized protein LOC127004942 isoform X2 n=1 Tax=Eriocheir sinensis TaxID=95602 RepID=UPI0021C9077C|nr:uncharacterized protein LOC127004942 isoform X2 [Eriocheir sinensis]
MEGGTPSLPCEEGYYHFATCCVAIVRGCEGQAVNNMTYWIQPVQFSGGTTCRLLVPKLSQEICFIRLDLRTFQLASPSDGRCDRDYLQVSGQNINAKVPTLCGFNSGQHLYVGVGRVPGPLELAVTTRGEEPRRRWEIEVTQVECGGERAPPDGCLQYYTSPQGFFASFNYLPTGASQYLNNLNYAVCLARATAFCSVTYSAGSKTADNTFQMVNFSVRNESTNGPFLVQVRTDAQYTGRGFNLSYAQNPC